MILKRNKSPKKNASPRKKSDGARIKKSSIRLPKLISDELEKSRGHIIVEIIEYIRHSVVTKTIIKKSTGNISVLSFDTGEGLTEKTSPFDTFAQIIEGKACIVIDKVSHLLKSGEGIIIPAHSPNLIKPNGRFKMILTIIKSGYE